ncbi:MAG: hypothetical protein GF311_08875 [Candidatus Lokiarchaeota archaeon]|nr:hypothetical protein [Candidatus Lokiarchaeota archaeon]
MSYATHEKKPRVSFANIERLSKIKAQLPELLAFKNRLLTLDDTYRLENQIESFRDEPGISIEEKALYEDTIDSLENYIDYRLKQSRLKRADRRVIFETSDEVTAYHVITLLIRDLGFDPLTFQPLNLDIFKGYGNIKYARHHFKAGRSWSIFTNDLVLTNSQSHPTWESLTAKEQAIIMDGFHRLIKMKGSGTNGAITEADIRKIFGDETAKGQKIVDRWIDNNGKDFKDFLNQFNERREMIQNGQIEEFIQNKYKPAYNRFFKTGLGIITGVTATPFELPNMPGLNFPVQWLINFKDADFLLEIKDFF